jgi:hypothetical protein
MNWNPFKPFGRERTEVADILERVLAGSMDCREWDDFISIPMKGAPELERFNFLCRQKSLPFQPLYAMQSKVL